jgi:hypothetical protein
VRGLICESVSAPAGVPAWAVWWAGSPVVGRLSRARMEAELALGRVSRADGPHRGNCVFPFLAI